MLATKDKGILFLIIEHCNRVLEKVNGITREEFNNDLDIREIFCFNLFQIGELSKKLSTEFIEKYNGVPWKYIKGMRDKIVHGYDTINLDIVWETSKTSVNELLAYCKETLLNN